MNLSAHAPMRPDCPAPPLAMRNERVPFVPYRTAYCGLPHDVSEETKGSVAARIKDAETNVDLTIVADTGQRLLKEQRLGSGFS